MFLDGTAGESLLYFDARVQGTRNRVTYVEWEKTIMGPIKDTGGIEQGGTKSTD